MHHNSDLVDQNTQADVSRTSRGGGERLAAMLSSAEATCSVVMQFVNRTELDTIYTRSRARSRIGNVFTLGGVIWDISQGSGWENEINCIEWALFITEIGGR